MSARRLLLLTALVPSLLAATPAAAQQSPAPSGDVRLPPRRSRHSITAPAEKDECPHSPGATGPLAPGAVESGHVPLSPGGGRPGAAEDEDGDAAGGFDPGALDEEEGEDGAAAGGGFDIEKVDVEEEPRWLIRGRGSLIAAFYPKKDVRTVDGVTGHTLSLSSVALYASFRVTDDVSLAVEVEYVGEDGGEIELDYAVVEWRAVAKLLTLSVGVNYVPFGIERFYYAPNRNPLVDRPAPFRQIFPGTYSDVGLFVKGRFNGETGIGLRYELAVVNGLRGPERDDRPSLETNIIDDNNDTPAFSGRTGLILAEGLEVGVSGYVGLHDDDDRYLLHLVGVDLRVELGGFRVLAEYLQGKVERSRDEGSSFHRQGYYATFSYRWEPDLALVHYLEPVVRVDGIDANSQVDDFLDVDRISAGIGWSPVEHFFLKVEYQWSFERHDTIKRNNLFFLEVGAWF